MANQLDRETARAAREDSRRLEEQSASEEPYPAWTTIDRPNRPSRTFNVRLTEEQFAAIQGLAKQRHPPTSTMARAWLLDRLEQEQHAS